MSSSTSNNACTAQNSRSSVQLDGKKKSTIDQRELQLLEEHQPWEMLDNTVLAIIDQTYAGVLGILGLVAPPEGGGSVKTWLLVDATDDPDSRTLPMLCVVEASARHCCIRLIDSFDADDIGTWCELPDTMRYISFSQKRRQSQKCRTSVSTLSGTVLLARTDGGGSEGDAGGQGGHGWKSTPDDGNGRADVSETKDLVGVLDTMRSHLDNAIQLENIVIRMANRSGCRCYDKLRESFMVRMALLGMRRQVDLGAVMRRCRERGLRRAREIGRRRPADEMDVDQVDEAEVLTKRLKAMHV